MPKITVVADSSATPGGLPAAPGNVTAILALGTIDPQTGQITMLVTVTPPSTLGTFLGCKIYLEAPDQSANSANLVGVTTVGSQPVGGKFNPIYCGEFVYVAAQQPWTILIQAPGTINWNVATPCRVYCVSYSANAVNTLVEANQSSPTPSQTFGLTPIAQLTPTSANNALGQAGVLLTNFITVQNLGNFNVSGKLKTAFEVLVNSVPDVPGYVYRLVATLATTDATNPKNQVHISGNLTEPGFIQSGGSDGIPIQHSFSIDTPTTLQNWVLWMQSGTVKNGKYSWNNIVPGITPSFPFSLTSGGSGTIDASQVLLSSIESYFAVNGPLLGINVDGITIQNTGGQFALVANGIDAGVYIKNATIVGAKIASATIVDANILNLSAAKITFGTLSGISITSVTITSTTASAISMSASTITASTFTCTNNGIVTALNNTTGPSGNFAGFLTSESGNQLEINTAAVNGFHHTNTLAFQLYNGGGGTNSGATLTLNNYGSGPSSVAKIIIGGNQVLGNQITGVGNPPSFTTFAQVQTYLQTLYNACASQGFLV